MSDAILIALLFSAMGLLIIAIVSFFLHYFIALAAPPSQRAAWIAGLAYLVAVGVFIFGGAAGYEYVAPIIPLPGGLVAFWFWRSEFRRAWINDPELIPDGTEIANDDWRMGLLRLLALVIVAVGAALIKMAFRNQ